MGVDVVLLFEIAEVFLKRPALVEEELQVGFAYGDGAHSGRQLEVGRRGHHAAVMVEFFLIVETAHNNHAETSEIHGLDVEIFYHERFEVVARYLI